ncbi:phosphatase PAP2 family protein [Streptomyces sp. NPDC048603]|uniref:phosphatase PAP2 family protein n=1 Tax=Streptomyces sp. NPDC048603 TaxID=3365577 RepID=UPI00371DCD21
MQRGTWSTSRWLRAACAGCLLLAAALTVAVLLRLPPLVRFDTGIAGTLHEHAVAHPAVIAVSRVLSDWVWDPWTMRALLVAVCGWLWWRGERALAVRFLLTLVVAVVVQQTVKAAVGRDRPVWPDPVDSADYAAYPSGHALTATVVCGLLLWLAPDSRWAWAVAAVSVLGVGFTRVYLGVHWPSDVLGGWLAGAVLVLAALSGAARDTPGGPLLRRPGSGDPDSG